MVAAADGIVVALRDGVPDVQSLIRPGEPGSGKRAAGNSVRVDHGNGWETQYSHMRQGSVTVHLGQRVRTGEQLGMVGLSGNTEFPHVDFTVRRNHRAVDPFAPSGENSNCVPSTDSLWKPEVLKNLQYIPTGILLTGWDNAVPDRDKARNGENSNPGSDAAALVFWVDVFGVQTGDRQTITIFDPQGRRMLEHALTISGNKAVWFSYAGKPRPPQGWMTGTYRAQYRLERDGTAAIATESELRIP